MSRKSPYKITNKATVVSKAMHETAIVLKDNEIQKQTVRADTNHEMHMHYKSLTDSLKQEIDRQRAIVDGLLLALKKEA